MENELVLLSADFKNRINEKNKIIFELKKSLIFSYGIVMALEEYEDVSFISILSEHLENMVIKHLHLETTI